MIDAGPEVNFAETDQAANIYAVDVLVTQIEQAMGRKKPIGFQIMIETAQGMANIDEIAAASSRNDSLHLGENDYAASVRARMTVVGGPNPDYSILTDPGEDTGRDRHWGDMWHYPLWTSLSRSLVLREERIFLAGSEISALTQLGHSSPDVSRNPSE